MKMDLKVNYAHRTNYNLGRTKPISYIVIHFTANDGDTDEGNGKYFSQPNRGASAHYFVDDDSVTLSVEEKNTAWHCGATKYKHKYCRNNNSIGVEMCSKKDNDDKYYIDELTVQNTANWVKKLMLKYNIPIDNVLRHYDITGKNCPEPFVRDEKQWDRFKRVLEGKEMEVIRYNNIEEIPEWGKTTIKYLIQKGCFADVNKLNLTEDMLRTFVINDRAGLYK